MGIKQVLIIKQVLWTDEWVYVCINLLITSWGSCSFLHTTNIARDEFVGNIRKTHVQEHLKENTEHLN